MRVLRRKAARRRRSRRINPLVDGLSSRITAAHRDFPVVNTPLIEAIRTMIAQGQGEPHPPAIAQALMEIDRLLPDAKS